ncbi:MAG: trypsin-like peptidase domain-containing protein [Bdellovibrionales bacterium]|nr:trypsin-like peptidase domain-containing protein [Bdellovibrionales bacterium]
MYLKFIVLNLLIITSIYNIVNATADAETGNVINQLYNLPPADLGFYKLSEQKVQNIQFVANSVYEIIIPGNESISLSEIIHKLKIAESYEAATNYLKNIYAIADNEEEKRGVGFIIAQIQNCQIANSPFNDCKIFVDYIRGTAFVTGDGTNLWTAFHNFKLLLHNSNKLFRAKINLPFFLINVDGNVIYESYLEPVKIDKLNLKYLDFNDNSRCRKFNLDWINLKLARSVGQGLTINFNTPKETEKYYLAGFPRKTTDRNSYSAQDSNGKQFYITTGRPRTKVNHLVCSKEPTQYTKDLFYLTADSAKGMSGGPILNSRGEVIGVYNSGFPYNNRADSYLTSIGVLFSNILNDAAD